MAAKTSASLDVGRRLRELREQRGIPKERMALELSMSAENWRHYESGRNQLAATMLPTIASLYGMTLAELASELLEQSGVDAVGHDADSGILAKHKTSLALYLDWPLSTCAEAFRLNRSPIRELIAAGRYQQTLLETVKNVQCSLQCNAV